MTVCAARATKPDGEPETCGFFTACTSALGLKACACGSEVREAQEGSGPNTVLRDLLEARQARVPDSARGSE